MKLVELVYASRLTAPLSMNDIVGLLDVARTNNMRSGITGMLTLGARRFLQTIEGSPEVVNALYCALVCDPRHDGLTILGYRPIEKRRFADWSMGFHNHGVGAVPAGAGPVGERFDPEAMTIDEAIALLTEMVRQMERSAA